MFFKNKIIWFLLLPIFILGLVLGFWYFLDNQNFCDSYSNLADLNSRHELVYSENSNKDREPFFCRIIYPDFLRTNLKYSEPEIDPELSKELIFKIADFAETEGDYLKNIVFMKLRTLAGEESITKESESLKSVEPNPSLEVPNSEVDKVIEGVVEVPQDEVSKVEIEKTLNQIEEVEVEEETPEIVEEEEEVHEGLPGTTEEEEEVHEAAAEEIINKPVFQNAESVLVAVIDSGVDITHPDLAGVVTSSWDFLQDRAEVTDELGHGTHIAGTISSNSPAARIMALKFTDGKIGTLSELIKAIRFAVDNGAEIINLSLGLKQEMQSVKDVLDYANSKGVIVVAAAGNYKSSEKYYPAAYENVISVTALKKNGEKLYQSNFGDWVDFSIAAQDVYSAIPGGAYGYRTGTSQAAALVTAKIAERLSVLKSQVGEADRFQAVYEYLESISESVVEGEFAGQIGRRILN